MAAFAYLLLPVTGLIAYLTGRDARARRHGLQAICLGLVWAIAMYAASLGPGAAVQAVFAAGGLIWLAFLLLVLVGRDPKLPWVGPNLEKWAEWRATDGPRSTSDS